MKISNIEKRIKKIETELKTLKEELKPKTIYNIVTTIDNLVNRVKACNLYVTDIYVSPDIYDILRHFARAALYDDDSYNGLSFFRGLPLTLKENRYNHISIGVSECLEQ